MSVLAAPRVFFGGRALWDPATMNNNDQWPTFDFPDAELNWTWLKTQDPLIDCENVRDEFDAWARTVRPVEQGGRKWCQPPGAWNYYGGNGWWLHTPTEQTRITGVQYEAGGEVVTGDDPLIGSVLEMTGDPFPGTDAATVPRMVDTNPDATWATCFFLRHVQIGSRTAPQKMLRGTVDPGTYMSSRWLNFQRNLDWNRRLLIAGVGGSVQQICVPRGALRLGGEGSPAIEALAKALEGPDVRGLMVRFSAYLTTYFNGAEFQDLPPGDLTARYIRLARLWKEQLAAGRTPMQNWAYSKVAGTVGLWTQDEPATAPGGRFLAATTPARVSRNGTAKSVWLGSAALEVHRGAGDRAFVCVDLGNTLPEKDDAGRKEELLGDLDVVFRPDDGSQPVVVGTLTPSAYATDAYERTAGIADLPVPEGLGPEELACGGFALRGADGDLLTEQRLTASTDARGIYLEQGEAVSFHVHVRDRGAIPRRDVKLLLQQYVPTPTPPAAGGDYPVRACDSQRPVRFLKDAGQEDEHVVPVKDGTAEVTIASVRPGFPVIAFFPYYDGDEPPVPPDAILPFGPPPSFTSAYYCCVRVMPFDDALPREFTDLLNTTGRDPDAAWAFVYRRILYLYDAIYPVMRYYGALDLGDREAVDRNIDQIVELAEPWMRDLTVYMPATRDLSNGKLEVLRMYRDLVRSRRTAAQPTTREAAEPGPDAEAARP